MRDVIEVTVPRSEPVSGLPMMPERATACYVLAHGAGASMTHTFMAAVAEGLFARRVGTLRYNFPAMERGARRPDRPEVAKATVRAAVAAASRLAKGLPLVAGGKSFGGRMTSQAQAEAPLEGVRALIFLGFPLHPAKKPAVERAAHLAQIAVPMLFLQGTRDALAQFDLLEPLVAGLGDRATLASIDQADHSFHVPAKSGRTDAEVLDAALDTLAAWIERLRASGK